MPTISTFRGIRAFINWKDQMLLGWAALHQDELLENWELASKGEDTFAIAPLA